MILYTVTGKVGSEGYLDIAKSGDLTGKNIYVNMTNKCPCNCVFCLRYTKELMESNTLWLKEGEPSVDEVIEMFDKYDLSVINEIVFCGYGEPLERLYDVCEVIDRLKGGEDFAKLAITYSKDENTVKDGGYLGFVNKGDVTDEVLNALKSLKDGSYSTTPIETTYGYHIVYRTSQKEKPELNDEVKEEIKTIIGKEIAAADGFSTTALTELREKYKMNILDSELKDSFKN